MKTSDFDYALPKDLIAQYPVRNRTGSRLLVLHRDTGRLEHRRFYHLPEYSERGDILVLNDTKVLPARLIGTRQTGGRVDMLLVNQVGDTEYEIMINTCGRVQDSEIISLGNGLCQGALLRPTEAGRWRIRFSRRIKELLPKIGKAPLPPYIKRDRSDDPFAGTDLQRYQTVYARKNGAIAAPTAGLHFTRGLLRKLARRGVDIVFLTLHIGLGTFKPITTGEVEDHVMEKEYYEVPVKTLSKIKRAQEAGKRIVAVGTTVCRALETVYRHPSTVRSTPPTSSVISGWTQLFICPPYQFQVVNTLMTNFHLPRGTPLLLASAFAGREIILQAYQIAIEQRYRFYSYGDAMLIL